MHFGALEKTLRASYDALEMACGYSSVIEIPKEVFKLPGLREIHKRSYIPATYHLTTAMGVLKSFKDGGMKPLKKEMFIRMITCIRKTKKAMKDAGKYYTQTKKAAQELSVKWRKLVLYALERQADYGKNIMPNIEKSLKILKRMLKDDYEFYVTEGDKVTKRIKAFDIKMEL